MSARDFRSNIKSQSKPFLIGSRRSTKEWLEQVLQSGGRNRLPSIGHRKLKEPVPRARLDADRLIRCSMRQGIAQKIRKELSNADRIAVDRLFEDEIGFNHSAGPGAPKFLDNLFQGRFH